jgi:ubiquinone/menaquinone biosynthesis C-methylase UbiE
MAEGYKISSDAEVASSLAAQRFKNRDASSYDLLTDEFDRFTNRLSRPLASKMISLARLAPSERILDIGTGTGIVALQGAQMVGAGGKVLGIDLSDGMLAAAEAKVSQAGFSNQVEFRKMDAEALDLADQSFDVVLSLFALFHFPNPLVALKEMLRVLRPGGRLIIAVGSGPRLLSVNGLAQSFRRLYDLSRQFQGKQLIAPGFLNSLVEKYFPEPEPSEETHLAREGVHKAGSVLPLVRRAGFQIIRSTWKGHRAYLDSPEEYWDIQRTFSSLARKRLSNAPPEKVEKLREEFISLSRKVQARGGKLTYPVAAFYVVAQRPPT